jgi:two-component system, chemotaxis family, response regulator Rcp1
MAKLDHFTATNPICTGIDRSRLYTVDYTTATCDYRLLARTALGETDMERVHILLAEDSDAAVRLLTECFREVHLEHQLDIAQDGETALAKARSAGHPHGSPCPDVFILDLGLPRVDGVEVLRAFRANEHCAHTPVIVFTSSVSPVDRAVAESMSGVYYYQKPLLFEECLAVGHFVKGVLLRAAQA